MSTSLCAQQRDQSGRYQIVKVPSMTNQFRSNPKTSTTGSDGSEDVLMVDTQKRTDMDFVFPS